MICCCCGESYPRNGKPQDPDRDTGFGWCARCKPIALADWVKHDDITAEEAQARWLKYYE